MADIPRESLTTDGKDLYPAWEEVIHEDAWWTGALLLALGFALLTIVLRRVQTWRARQRERTRVREEVEQVCRERKLSPSEARTLQETLRQAALAAPADAVHSEPHFDRFVAPFLGRRAGEATVEAIREKLFGEPLATHDGTPFLESTRSLVPGQRMSLHFRGFPGSYVAMVNRVAPEGVDVVFPADADRDWHFEPHDRVEAVLAVDDALVSFASEVVEVSPTPVYTCRIAHTAVIALLHQRASTRFPTEVPVRFVRIPAKAKADTKEPPWSRHQGTLVNISLGGCSLATPPDAPFVANDEIVFRLNVVEGLDPIRCWCRVTGVRRQSAERMLLHLSFTERSEDVRDAVAFTIARERFADTHAGPTRV